MRALNLVCRLQDLAVSYLLVQPITDGSSFVQMAGLVMNHLAS
jgi:hypothetical protein